MALPSPHTRTRIVELLDQTCPCGHVVDRHDSGPRSRKRRGCRVLGCPCACWWRIAADRRTLETGAVTPARKAS